ncbi:hypothetical protein B4119_0264 [Parageobacillus caldoxylosilyticus]|uniref:Uncharacterized protein n=1 Tax=Saccharococcus caldoxylosilyticus TaxID=81408 RepID=A0A150LWP2_9BACL|nr:hypothetical protein B4119_0264 [Parageobacillus caldoxylosilyticus]
MEEVRFFIKKIKVVHIFIHKLWILWKNKKISMISGKK